MMMMLWLLNVRENLFVFGLQQSVKIVEIVMNAGSRKKLTLTLGNIF